VNGLENFHVRVASGVAQKQRSGELSRR